MMTMIITILRVKEREEGREPCDQRETGREASRQEGKTKESLSVVDFSSFPKP